MSLAPTSSRRQFVKLFAFGVVTTTLSGRALHQMIIGEAQAATGNAGLLTVKLSSFPALQSANSSIRLALNPFISTTPLGPFYPILINRTAGNQFYALQARCTHDGCVVPTAGNSCPCHGSVYNLDGTVAVGPAFNPLASYPITFDGNDLLTIQIAGLGYSVTGSSVETTPGPRFQLTFPTQSGLTYEVQFRESADSTGSVVAFASSANGTANLTSLSGNGANQTVYVARTTAKGFYTVNIKVTQS